MPMFEYKCRSCGKFFEQLRLASDDSVIYCDNCGSDNVVKLFSNFASNSGCGSDGFT